MDSENLRVSFGTSAVLAAVIVYNGQLTSAAKRVVIVTTDGNVFIFRPAVDDGGVPFIDVTTTSDL